MKATEFNQLKQSISSHSPKKKTDLEQCLLHPSAQLEVIKFFERALDACPHCHHGGAYKWGTSKGRQRYRCKSYHKTFNALTGSVLNGLRKPEPWAQDNDTMTQ
jgi:hypothetical protein